MIRLITILLFFSLFGQNAFAGWTLIRSSSTEEYFCGYFFDPTTGFVGGGGDSKKCCIIRTTDGGATWNTCAIPSSDGHITSIFMYSRTIGYASAQTTSRYSILKTTDGGVSWFDFSLKNRTLSTCIYATSKAVINTSWKGDVGGVFINNGTQYSEVFKDNNTSQSNGIDFLDDLNGMVTMGPSTSFFGSASVPTFATSDGGLTWQKRDLMRESWGIYAEKTTRSYFSFAEDQSGSPGSALWRTTNNGVSWRTYGPGIPNTNVTGHIAGVGKTFYVQSVSISDGLYRTDDNGLNWKAVGGPANSRDTRFCVTGCNGAVVFAFDNIGNIKKTTDGGDGTLLQDGPYIGPIESVEAGKTTLIPIAEDTLETTNIVDSLFGTLSLNDDVLEPDSLVFKGSQLEKYRVSDTVYKTAAGWVYSIKLKKNSPVNGSSTLPLFFVRAKAYLSDTITTNVSLDGITFIAASKPTVLSRCTQLNSDFTLTLTCGDSILVGLMKGDSLHPFFTVRPNPASGIITLSSSLPTESLLTITLIDLGGRELLKQNIVASSGNSEHQLDVSAIASGEYILTMTTPYGMMRQIKIVIRH